jgi:hypothetical protein
VLTTKNAKNTKAGFFYVIFATFAVQTDSVSTHNGSSWVAQSTNRFVHDGWNLVAEFTVASSVAVSTIGASVDKGLLTAPGTAGRSQPLR